MHFLKIHLYMYCYFDTSAQYVNQAFLIKMTDNAAGAATTAVEKKAPDDLLYV